MDYFFRFIFFGFCVFLIHPTVVSVLLSASVERFNVSRMQDFFNVNNNYRFSVGYAPEICCLLGKLPKLC